jgi:chaperone required for assembly of F1-ATPase
MLYWDFAAIHHRNLPSGSAVCLVFLLPGRLEVDIATRISRMRSVVVLAAVDETPVG